MGQNSCCKSRKASRRRPSAKELLGNEEEGVGYADFDSASMTSKDSDVFSDEEGEEGEGRSFHTLIIDCAPIGFADSMGVAMIEQVRCIEALKVINISRFACACDN